MSTEKEYFKEVLDVAQSQGVALLEFYAFIRDKGLEEEFYKHRSLQRKQMTKPGEDK
ncbi:hypothetical protein [Bacillus sp. NPDC094106]|uniref:hypothetical protein n=1 Tax=Bacillus sp. NPDC094106 TaxID=3363949 RepID=UPI003810050D